jgi:hypothetical protein
MTPDDFTLLMADPVVRRVFSAVALGASTSAAILSASGLGAPQAAPAIGRLTRAGLLVPEGRGRLGLGDDALRAAAETAARRQEEEAAAEQPDPRLRGFVRGGVLVNLPDESDQDARRTVLRHVAQTAFAADDVYDERTVTDRLRPWCEDGALDVASLRRVLVDLGLLHRESGRYRLTAPVTTP